LFTVTLLLLGGGLLGLTRLEVRQDIEAMLPDDGSRVAEDFRRLQQAPFARKVLISLHGDEGIDTGALLNAADRLAAALPTDSFHQAMTGPAVLKNFQLPEWLAGNLPNLLTAEDLRRIAADLTPEQIGKGVESGYQQMLSPEGWLAKKILRRDPLDLRRYGLEKLRFVNPIGKTRLHHGHFLSADGHSALIIADSPVRITDSQGGARLLAGFAETAAKVLPPWIKAELVSGHRYTVVNATAVQRDLFVVLSASTLALIALFLVFLRSWRALFVFLIPVAVVGLAAVAVSLFNPIVSGITLGFGAVLLGIAVDYGLHVYFALRQGDREPWEILRRLTNPILFSALTTLAGFAVLLTSNLPGQRQLAIFAMTGMLAALLLALLVLPHLLKPAISPERSSAAKLFAVRRGKAGPVVVIWLAVMVLCGWQVGAVRISGELRSLSLIPDDLAAAEQQLKQTWGDLRSMAMVFSEGADSATALTTNDRLFASLRRQFPNMPLVSLAPLLPSPSTQAANRKQWQEFWHEHSDSVQRMLSDAAAPFGFSPAAFEPFFAELERLPKPVTAEALRRLGLGELLDALLIDQGAKVQVVTLVPDTPQVAAWFSADQGVPAGVHLVSQSRFGEEVGDAIRADFLRFVTLAGMATLIMVTFLLRRPQRILLALLPVATGLVVMFGIMGWLGLTFNLFNIMATILVIGLGVDYGIFMVCLDDQDQDPATRQSVLIAGLTTLAGFGALVFAGHPSLHSIGVTVLLGIGAAIPTALLVIPALQGGRQ